MSPPLRVTGIHRLLMFDNSSDSGTIRAAILKHIYIYSVPSACRVDLRTHAVISLGISPTRKAAARSRAFNRQAYMELCMITAGKAFILKAR